MRSDKRHLTALACFVAGWGAFFLGAGAGHAGAAPAPAHADWSGYRTAATVITAAVASATNSSGQSGYLGVNTTADARGALTVEAVDENSPADQAGVRPGDTLLACEGRSVTNAATLREWVQSQAPGAKVTLRLARQGQPLELRATLAATSRPMRLGAQRGVLGVRTAEPKDGDGALVQQVTAKMPAARAGLKAGDVILKVDGAELTGAGPSALTDALAHKEPGDSVTLTIQRHAEEFDVETKLAADPKAAPRAAGEGKGFWRSHLYRLAVVSVEFPDVKQNSAITTPHWTSALFSQGAYQITATGQPAYGSLQDFYLEQSCGALRVEGRVFDAVSAAKKRPDYMPGTSAASKTAFLAEALDALLAREGTNALKSFDGLCFIYAGERVSGASRGSLFWAHKGTVKHGGKTWSYIICPEGGPRMSTISVFCHEFGHLLGLPDQYARPENPGSEGLGIWCAMSNQSSGGRPQHFCAWCKEQLGWLKPVLLDPTVQQKLLLAPVEGATNECFKVLARADGSECFLLENRARRGFDRSLPGEGLLIWRVVRNKPILEESHGVDGPEGPRVFTTAVPYPSGANHAFTPYTTPSSRALLGSGWPVHLTNIRRVGDGRIAFQLGYEFE